MNAVQEFVRIFTEKEVEDVIQIGKEFFQINPDLGRVMQQANNDLNREAEYAGTVLGSLKGTKFTPSIPLLDIIGKTTKRWIMIDDNAEWLFMCGRDLFGKSITEANVKKGKVLVLNRKKEVLGYGIITGPLSEKETVCVDNLLDRGDFLRREMKKKGR